MPQQRSRTRAVIPGRAILGKAGAEAAARKTMGGAVVPGRAILGDQTAQEEAHLREAQFQAKADPKQATGAKPKPEGKKDDGLPPLVAPSRKTKDKAAVKASLTEEQAVTMLDSDPDAWEKVLDFEMERPDGPRPAIAAAILAIAPKVTGIPIPADAIEALKVIALEPPHADTPAAPAAS